jgi:uncharacterized protein (DUF952 family)
MPDNQDQQSCKVFKIVSATVWANAVKAGAFAGSADDVRDGYIHLSSASQLHGTLHKYFTGQPDVLLVAFDQGALAPNLKWEPSRGGELFPHFYGPLPVSAALWQKPLVLGSDGVPEFDEAQVCQGPVCQG